MEGTFTVAYLVFNTIMNVTTQAGQVDCFRNVAAHLEPGGCFVVEVGVPELRRLPPGETDPGLLRRRVSSESTSTTSRTRASISHHFEIVNGRAERNSVPFRYVWPAELDLMAQLAGLTPPRALEGWRDEPFTSESRTHVSVWEKPSA